MTDEERDELLLAVARVTLDASKHILISTGLPLDNVQALEALLEAVDNPPVDVSAELARWQSFCDGLSIDQRTLLLFVEKQCGTVPPKDLIAWIENDPTSLDRSQLELEFPRIMRLADKILGDEHGALLVQCGTIHAGRYLSNYGYSSH